MEQHKAYLFSFSEFTEELFPILLKGIIDNTSTSLASFINENMRFCKSPYDGEPLTAEWSGMMENHDVQEYGDFALTKYYDPRIDIGIGTNWESISCIIGKENVRILLGDIVSQKENVFNPGRIGSYFQSHDHVHEHLRLLENFISMNGDKYRPKLSKASRMLKTAIQHGKGLYITF